MWNHPSSQFISICITRIVAAYFHECIIDAVLTGEEVVLLKSKAALLEERNALSLAPISFLDVREKLQLLCDQVSYDK